MGRPLNKRFFGTPTNAGNEIKVQFHNGAASVNGWIIKQLGSKKFRCTDGTETKVCTLVDKLTGAIAAGEMTITVKDDDGVARQVTKIAGRKVTLDTGVSIAWNMSDANNDNAVEMEEAGSETASEILVATALVTNGIVYQIVTAGNTDFTTFGAADSDVGTIFTMAAQPGTGTGTVRIAPDDFEADE
jgi:hypothetical protein